MRAVDAAARRALEVERPWERIVRAVLDWQPFGSPPPTAASEATDLQLLLATLREDADDSFDSLPAAPGSNGFSPNGRPFEDSRGRSLCTSIR
jgi:hypothetical protein